MFQQFFEDTLMSRYIKGMLSYTRIPLIIPIESGDIILEGCQYLWNEWVIKCVSSGKFSLDGVVEAELYPGKTIFPSVALYPLTGEALATYTIIDRYFEGQLNSSYCYKSNCNYYDSDTHYHLGKYLRYLKVSKGINLMPYYNCYNYKIIDDICLTTPLTSKDKGYELRTDTNYKVMAIPINFGKDYTIAIESSSTVRCRCVLYGESGLLVSPSLSNSDITYISDEDPFVSSYREFERSSFKDPIIYRIDTNIGKLHSLQKNLYLLIQVPAANNSSLIVLEGDYTNSGSSVIKTTYDPTHENNVIVPAVDPNLSLLFANSGKTYAFSDRLIEYLLGNVITPMDDIAHNIYKVQKAVKALDPTYYEVSNSVGMDAGYWDDRLTHSIGLILSGQSNSFPFTFDVDTNINKDVERFFLDKLGEY